MAQAYSFIMKPIGKIKYKLASMLNVAFPEYQFFAEDFKQSSPYHIKYDYTAKWQICGTERLKEDYSNWAKYGESIITVVSFSRMTHITRLGLCSKDKFISHEWGGRSVC
jgi:hypothetical protein